MIGHDHVIARSKPGVDLVKVSPKGLHRLAERRQLGARLLIDKPRENLRSPGNGEGDKEELYAAVVEVKLHNLPIIPKTPRSYERGVFLHFTTGACLPLS